MFNYTLIINKQKSELYIQLYEQLGFKTEFQIYTSKLCDFKQNT